jgi:flagellar protein FliO/FliZ
MIRFAALAFAATPLCARAADAAALPDAGGVWRAMLGLAIVLALIFATGWVMRRIAPARGSGDGPMRIVASRALGARERIVLVEVADQWVMVGVAPGNVRSLATLPRGTLPAPESTAGNAFTALLTRATQKARGDAGEPR